VSAGTKGLNQELFLIFPSFPYHELRNDGEITRAHRC